MWYKFLRCYSLMATLLVFSFLSLSAISEPISPILKTEPDNPEEVLLGKRLFHSVKLSRDNTVSCASCHNLSEGGDDGAVVSTGIDQQLGEVNAPTVLNSGLNAFQFWDGRVETLEEQIEGPIHSPLEMDSNWKEVINKLQKDEELVELFAKVYKKAGRTRKNSISEMSVARAIAAYERQLVTANSPFDQYLLGREDAISDDAVEGYELFKKMGCVSCHQGQNVGGNMFQYFGVMGDYFQDRGKISKADYGRFNVTGEEEDRYKFKVPGLRNVELTAPYFHDGSAKNLEEAIRIMARYQLGRTITDDQAEKLKAFLVTLTGKIEEDLK